MKPHHQLTIIRNRHRAAELRAFRDLVEDYFRQATDADDQPMDWEGAQATRARINQMLPRVIQIVRAADLDGSTGSHLTTDPGPALGRVEVLQRIFSARYTDGQEQEVLDVLDMALGVYDGDRYTAMGRTVNPLHYLATALAFLARGPRRFLAVLGVRRRTVPRAPAADLTRLEAVASRLSDVEELLESRLATLQDRQAARHAEHGRQIAELAERLDFAERVLAQPEVRRRLAEPERSDVVTPV